MLKMCLASVVHCSGVEVAMGGECGGQSHEVVRGCDFRLIDGVVGQEPWELPGVQKLRRLSVGIMNRNQPAPQCRISTACLQSKGTVVDVFGLVG